MSVDDLTRELERLRADVKALEAARAQPPAAVSVTDAPSPAAPSVPSPAPVDSAAADSGASGTAPASGPAGAPAMGGGAVEGSASAAVSAEQAADPQLRSQIEELGDLLHDELKSMPAVTSLTVFALGILFGRFLR